MKHIPLLLFLVTASFSRLVAALPDSDSFPHGKLVFEETMSQPPSKDWNQAQGKWECKDGAWTGVQPDPKGHGPSIHHALPVSDGVITMEFKFATLKGLHVAFNDKIGHVCRLMVEQNLLTARRDTYEHKADVNLQTAPLKLEPNTWYTLNIQLRGDDFQTRIGSVTAGGQHAELAKTKVSFAIGMGNTAHDVEVRNFRIWELPAGSAKH